MESAKEGQVEEHPAPTKALRACALQRRVRMASMRRGKTGHGLWCMWTQTAIACMHVKRVHGLANAYVNESMDSMCTQYRGIASLPRGSLGCVQRQGALPNAF